MIEFEIALLSASWFGISKERLSEMQSENPVLFSLHFNLGQKIKLIKGQNPKRNLEVEYQEISSNATSFGPLHKKAFEWYFGINTALNPYKYSKDFPTLHKAGFLLELKFEEGSHQKEFVFRADPGLGELFLAHSKRK